LNNAGCTIICDDVGYYSQPFFEDGIVATHVRETLNANNIIFVSSAGNSANLHYQGFFFEKVNGYHDFSEGGSPQKKELYFILPPGTWATAFLQWNDKWGQSNNDYNLQILDLTNGIFYFSGETQNGDDDPLEQCSVINNGIVPCLFRIDVRKEDDSQPKSIEILIRESNLGLVFLDNINPADSIF